MARKKLLFLCLIPVILLILEIVFTFTGMQYSHGSWVMSGWNLIGVLAVYGSFFLPFICLLPEIIGFVMAAKQKSAIFRMIFITELTLTLAGCLLSVVLLFQSLHHK